LLGGSADGPKLVTICIAQYRISDERGAKITETCSL
jgi:hypothetical protein